MTRTISVTRRGWVIAAVAVVLTGLVLYVGGRWHERSRTQTTDAALRAEISDLERERARGAESLAAARVQLALLKTRTLLFETALDLERRNFGTANERLEAAARELAAAREAGGGPEIAEIRDEIAGLDLRVAEDLQQQRSRVLALAARLEEVLGRGPE
jgi:chromosome segregation ATPase